MSAVFTLVAISAIGGLVLGLCCVPWPLIVIPNLIVAIVSVIVSLCQNFSFVAGVAIFFGCLCVNQMAYVIGAAIIVFSQESKASLTNDDYPGKSHQSHNAYLSTLLKLKALLAAIRWYGA